MTHSGLTQTQTHSDSLITQVTFIDPKNGMAQDRMYNLVNHEERKRVNKLVIWAVNNFVELRVRRLPESN